MRFTIVTGLSGAGRSTALKTLEDMGFFCADNLPPQLIPGFAQVTMNRVNPPEDVAVVVDMRMGDMFDSIYEAIDELKKMDLTLHILFLDASDEQLVSRFKQTRRLHPVSGSGKIMDGISRERDKLQRIKDMAHTVLDTSVLPPANWPKCCKAASARAMTAGCTSLSSLSDTNGASPSMQTWSLICGFCPIPFMKKHCAAIRG